MSFVWLWCVTGGSSLIKKKKQCTILVSGVDSGGGYARVGAGGIWEVSGSYSQFCCKPNTAPKQSL